MKWLLCDSTGKGARFFSPSKTYWLQLDSTFYCADNISEFAHSIFSLLIETVMWSHLCSARDPHSALVGTAPVESCQSCSDMARCVKWPAVENRCLLSLLAESFPIDMSFHVSLLMYLCREHFWLQLHSERGKNICKHVKQLRTLERERNRKRINLEKFHVQ